MPLYVLVDDVIVFIVEIIDDHVCACVLWLCLCVCVCVCVCVMCVCVCV